MRIHGGEQCGQIATFGKAEERGALRAGGVHHRADVVHPLFVRRQLRVGHAIGEARAALVENDQTREGGQPLEEARPRRLLPRQLDVRHPAGDEDQIQRPFADDLVGDVDVAALRVSRLGCHDPKCGSFEVARQPGVLANVTCYAETGRQAGSRFWVRITSRARPKER